MSRPVDCNNSRPAQGESNPSTNPNMNPGMNPNINPNMNTNAANMNPNMNANDWRTQLSPDSRQRIVNKIMDILKKQLPFTGPDGLDELKKIAVRFEERIYTEATSQTDYLRKIPVKMLAMENTSLTTTPATDSLPSDGTRGNQNPQDAVRNQQQQHLPIPMGNQSQSRQLMIQQNHQNNICSAVIQSSATLPPTGATQTSMSCVGQNSSLPSSIAAMSPNSNSSSLVATRVAANMFSNSQRPQLQVRQHGLTQQPVQNPQQFNVYQQQMVNKKLHVQPPLLQSQLQQQTQQTLLQTNQMQGPQQSLMQLSSGLPTSQTTLQQTQPSIIQSTAQSSLQPNPQSSMQQSTTILQQHHQSVMRQQQPSQQSPLLQQQTPLGQQQLLPSQQQKEQQQLLNQQSSGASIQQNQLLSQQQQNNLPDMQQRQLLGQQQQQLMGQQNNISKLHQQMGPQSNIQSMLHHQQNMRLQAKVVAAQQQQQNQQGSSALLSPQGHQGQPQPQQQHLISHLQPQPQPQPQPPQLQQIGLQQQQQQQQQPSVLQRDMQQRTQTSCASLQPQSAAEQQRQQLFQSQRGLPDASSTYLDSTTQTGQNGADWQEELYQKIKSLKDLYYLELSEMYNRIDQKFQQVDALPLGQKPVEQMDKVKYVKTTVERMLQFLTVPKGRIVPLFKEKLPVYEKQILNFLNSHRIKKPSSIQKMGGPSSVGLSQPTMSQQATSQIPQLQHHDSHMNQIQPMNVQGSVTSSIQHGGLMASSSHLGIPKTQQNMMNSLQTASNLDLVQGNSLPQGMMNTGQQTTVNASHQTNVSTLSQGVVNTLQPNMNTLESNANILQHQQHLMPQQDRQQQMIQAQQLKQQFQQHQVHPQLIQQHQKQQLMLEQQQQLRQQQLHQQQKQHMPQIHQMNNDVNDLKVRQGTGMMKQGMFPQHHQPSQRSAYHHQQLKAGLLISSPQLIQSQSPQISQHPSPQIDQQNVLTSLPKSGTPLQTAGSPFIPSPSTSLLASSPIPGDSEKPQTSAVSSISNAGNIGYQQIASTHAHAQSLAIGTPGISASPLLAESSGPDGNQVCDVTSLPGKSNMIERPLECLIKVVRSMSPKAVSSSVSDIGSVVSMVDRIAGSAPGNGSRAAVGEDLVAMTKSRLQGRNIIPPDGSASATTKKMRRLTSAMPLNAVSSACSVNYDSLKLLNGLEISELESTATSRIKRQKVEANLALLDEIREINSWLIDTVVGISDEGVGSIAAATEGEGAVVKCSFSAVAFSPSLKSQLVSAQMSPILPLRLLVPINYPNCSPVVLDKIPDESRTETEDLSVKANSRFNMCLRGLSQPMSLAEMARTWDACARKVILDYAQQSGGGSFSSSYGTWESCVSA